MTLRFAILALVALGVTLASSCNAAHGPTLDEQLSMLEAVRDAECARALACETWQSTTSTPCNPDSLAAMRVELTSGRARVDVDAARACLDGIAMLGECLVHVPDASLPIDPAERLEATCRAAFVQERVACGAGTCAPSEWCDVGFDCARRCRPRPSEGENCDVARCREDLACVAHVCVAGYRCHGGGLTGTLGLGGICWLDPGAPCDDGYCGPSAYCAEDTHVCVEGALTLGASCSASSGPGCARGLTCIDGACASGGCTSRVACGALFCGADGSCTSEPEGSRCGVRSVDLLTLDDCPEGYLCAPDERCHRALALGDACDESSACPPGSLCASGRCARIARLGSHCDAATPCQSRTYCLDGICGTRRPGLPGGACLADGTCRNGVCDGGHCALLPIGSACTRTTECPTCDGTSCRPPIAIPEGEACTLGAGEAVCGGDLVCSYVSSLARTYCCPPL